jgi:hypothetical protein
LEAPVPTPYDAPLADLSGTADFRMMPTDDAVEGYSTASTAGAAGGRALLLSYTWQHPEDGEQSGTLLLGLPADDGAVSAAWVDSWHQADVIALAGRATPGGAVVGYEYAPGWSWEVELQVGRAGLGLVMRNVVPEGEDGPSGPYDVMHAHWR